jgi:hypothetical protein
MYADLTTYQQILLAIEFHLMRSAIPAELSAALGPALIKDILGASG